jgi:membrane associated rhomboid family serine protease
MKLSYNAPFVLTFTLICLAVYALSTITDGWLTREAFSIPAHASLNDATLWLRFFLYPMGHMNMDHLVSNILMILLVGPALEEKYGWKKLLLASVITALATGIIVVLTMHYGLLGASGIVFMFIIMGSFANLRQGQIPMTFILVAVLYLGNELSQSFANDQISQLAHLIGGICGALLGFFMKPGKAA